jgi:hypothetical protein
MADYKMAAVKVTPPNDFSLVLIRSHMVVIHLFHMLCDLERVVIDLCLTLYLIFLLLGTFRSLYSAYCLCVNVYCSTANGCQPNCI